MTKTRERIATACVTHKHTTRTRTLPRRTTSPTWSRVCARRRMLSRPRTNDPLVRSGRSRWQSRRLFVFLCWLTSSLGVVFFRVWFFRVSVHKSGREFRCLVLHMDGLDQEEVRLEERRRSAAKKWCVAATFGGNWRSFVCVGITLGAVNSGFRSRWLIHSRERETSPDACTTTARRLLRRSFGAAFKIIR